MGGAVSTENLWVDRTENLVWPKWGPQCTISRTSRSWMDLFPQDHVSLSLLWCGEICLSIALMCRNASLSSTLWAMSDPVGSALPLLWGQVWGPGGDCGLKVDNHFFFSPLPLSSFWSAALRCSWSWLTVLMLFRFFCRQQWYWNCDVRQPAFAWFQGKRVREE